MNYRAFIEDDDTPFRIEYYHNPSRWIKNAVATDNPIMDVNKWSQEIKYMNKVNENDFSISDDIRNLPTDTGGIYIFFIKGISLPFIENYIVYIGRCQYTEAQNINKRAKEYFVNDYLRGERLMIQKMFKHWKDHLYYRYYPDTDNDNIKRNEAQLIRAILPPLNEVIPDKMDIRETIPAFN